MMLDFCFRRTPTVIWAQRAGKIYLTINLEDCVKPEIKIEKDKLTFAGKGGSEGREYAVTIPFYKEVDPENSKYAVLARNIPCVIVKAEEGPFWPRLLKEAGKNHWLKTDFDKWQDEDDSDVDESGDRKFEDMMKQMGGLGGMGGMGGMDGDGDMPNFGNDDDDSDDEDLPDLADVN